MHLDSGFDDPDMGPPLCLVCEEAPGSIVEPHLGPVCTGCYLCLVEARGAMDEIGPRIGISRCAERSPR